MNRETLREINQLPFEGVRGFTLCTIINLVAQGKVSLDEVAAASEWHGTFKDPESRIKAQILEALWLVCQENDIKNATGLTATLFHQLPQYLQ